MRSTCLLAGVGLAALAALAACTNGAAAQPHGPASAAPRSPSNCPIPPGWGTPRSGRGERPHVIGPIVNEIAVLPGGAHRWNGAPIDPDMLRSFLELAGQMYPPPELLLWPDEGAGCADLAATAAFIAAHYPCTPDLCRIGDASAPRPSPHPAAPLTGSADRTGTGDFLGLAGNVQSKEFVRWFARPVAAAPLSWTTSVSRT